MADRNIAELLVSTLKAAGVERIYGIVGDSLNAVTEALRRDGSIEWIHVRHEEVAAFAAGAEAHLTGSIAVCAGSCGPGNLHLINGLFDCHRSRVPVLAIAAQIPSSEIGRSYFQETNPKSLFADCSGYCEVVTTAQQLPGVFETAIRSAYGTSSVSVVVLPGDVAMQPAPPEARVSAALLPARPVVVPPRDGLERLASAINGASKVTLLCGRGCRDSHEQLMMLADRLRAPVVHALGGKEYVEYDNPYDVGMTGLIGFSSGYKAIERCDLLLMLGTDFPYRQFYPENARVVQIDIRPEALGRRCALELGLVGDVGATISAVLPLLDERTDGAHLDGCVADYRRARQSLDDLASAREGGPMHPQFVAATLDASAAEDAIVTFDVGTPAIWSARYLKMNGRRRLIGSLIHGSMANALPQAIGAQASHPGRQVISFSGDGGLAMLMGDLMTLRQHDLPVKVVVLNNGTLGFVEMEMKAAGFLDVGVALDNPDLAAVASAIGLFAIRVSDPLALPDAMAKVLAHDGPALIDVVTARQELALPPRITAEQAKGFGLWTLRAVIDGRGAEVIDLATTNLFR